MRLLSLPGGGEELDAIADEMESQLATLNTAVAEFSDRLTRLRAVSRRPDKQEAAVPTRLLTVAQAATALGLGRSTVENLIRTGDLGSRKIGKARRVPVEELDAYISRLGRSA